MYKLPNGKIVYPEDIECVHDPVNGKGGIFIGNLESAENLNTLKKHGIKAVLTACKGTFLNHSKNQVPYQLYIPGQDHQKFDLSKYFGQSIKFIHEALQSTNILVHCLGGVSRSVTLVMAYFIKHYGMTYDQVYAKIKAKRKIIYPNDSFIEQLKKFQYQLKEKGQFHATVYTDKYEIRSSYSPAKRQERRAHLRGYEGDQYQIENSPKKYYESPEKRYNNMRTSAYLPYSNNIDRKTGSNNFHTSTVKNPEFHRSIVQQMQQGRKQRQLLSKQVQISHFSPQKYKKYDTNLRSSVGGGLKRLSSMNVDLDRQYGEQSAKKNQLLRNYDNPNSRLSASQYQQNYSRPFDNIQNKESIASKGMVNVDDIDKKIAQIRKKYQDVASRYPEEKSTRPSSIYERKYSNVNINNERNYQHNENNKINKYDDFLETRLKKTTSDNPHMRGVGGIRPNYVTDNNNELISSIPTMNRLKRMQSYQV